MKPLFLTALLSVSTASFASEREPALLSGNALVSDGDSHELLVVLPDLPENASIRAKLKGASVIEAEMLGHGLARVRVTPKSVDRPMTRTLEIRAETEEAKTKTQLEVDILPGPAGTLRVTMDPPTLPGSVTEAQVRVRFDGSHPIPEEARGVQLTASSGSIGEAVRMPDGSFVARYTADSNRKAEIVVISAADVHFPDELLGAVVLPIYETRNITFPATPGATHLLRVGEREYGPFQPNESEFSVRVDIDPRFPMGTLEITPADGEASKEEVWFAEEETLLGSLHFFPLPESVPEGSELQLHVLALDSNGAPYTEGGLLLGPHEMDNLGSGVYRRSRTAPLGEATWTLQAFLNELEVNAEIPLTAPLPSAPPLSRVKAVDRPVSHVLIWPLAPLSPGQESTLRVVAVDEWGLPIANSELSLGVPSGDALLPPSAKTDGRGMADLSIRVGSDANPIVVRIGAEGLAAEQVLPVHSSKAFHPAGDEDVQALYDAWWTLASDGDVARRPRYSASPSNQEGPGSESIVQEEAPPPPPVEKPIAENGIRWRAQILDLGRRHATVGEANSIFPKQVDYTKGLPLGIIGLDGGVSWDIRESLSLDVRGQISLLNQDMPAEIQGGFPSDVQVGVVHKQSVAGFDVYAGVWGHRFDALVARYVSRAGGSVALPPVGIYGARVGVGAQRFIRGFNLSVEVAETFSPWPVNLGVNAGIALPDGDFGLPDGLHFRLDYAYNFHQMQFTLEDYTAAVYEGLNALKLGVGGQF